jgi:hypothetical protein
MKFIYVDTSVFGGKFDIEFEYWTNKFFNQLKESNVKILRSNVVADELIGSPEKVQNFVHSLPEEIFQDISLSKDAIKLAGKYIEECVVGKSSKADCFHIAMSTIQKADLLVSWNFKHIVNIKRIHGYNAVNLKNGYQH